MCRQLDVERESSVTVAHGLMTRRDVEHDDARHGRTSRRILNLARDPQWLLKGRREAGKHENGRDREVSVSERCDEVQEGQQKKQALAPAFWYCPSWARTRTLLIQSQTCCQLHQGAMAIPAAKRGRGRGLAELTQNSAI